MRRRTVLIGLVTLLLVGVAGVGAWTQRHRWLPGAAESHAHDDHDKSHAPPELTVVKISDEAARGLNLRTAEVRLEDYPRVLEVPGMITEAPGRERAVASPVAGIVAQVFATPGQAVRPGAPLFTVKLASEIVQTTQTELARSAKDLVAATARRDQTKKLVAAGTKPGIELIEEENQVRRLTTQVEGHRRQLRLFGFTEEQVKKAEAGDFVTEITIPVPPANEPGAEFAFEVESLAVAQGQGVTSGQLLARLADYRELHIDGEAFETEAALVSDATGAGRAIGVDFLEPANGRASEAKLVIDWVGKTDPATRTFHFHAPLDNTATPYTRGGKTYLAWQYRPGRQVRLRIPTGSIPKVIVLAAEAVVREGADAFVFRQNGDAFERKAVTVVGEDRLNVAIAPGNGIEPGVWVLQNNAAAVNRALKAAQAKVQGAGGVKGHWHADGTFHAEEH